MCQKLSYFLILFLIACSSPKTNQAPPLKDAAPHVSETAKEFSRGEIILATELLVKIFDQEMGPLACVPDHEEAELLLRTIRPRMEVIEDDLGALLDNKEEVKKLIKTCDQSCICGYVDELLREHMVVLSKDENKLMNAKKTPKEISRCFNYAKETFCQGELYKELNKEKADFSYDEESP
jgi:hypothetical protein